MDQKRKIRKIFSSIIAYSLEFFFFLCVCISFCVCVCVCVCVYFFLEIYSSEYSPKAIIFQLKLLIMTLFGLRLVLCLTRDEER